MSVLRDLYPGSKKGTSAYLPAYSLPLPAQLSAPEISVDYSPGILPNMPQTGVFTAQI